MWLISILLAAFALALTGYTLHEVRRQERAVAELYTLVTRARIYRAERARFAAERDKLGGAADATTATMDLPTAITRLGHETIATIPFAILEQIPATAETTKIVHAIHDEIASNVYDAISGTTRGIAGFIRRGMAGPGDSPQPGAGRPAPRPKPGAKSDPNG